MCFEMMERGAPSSGGLNCHSHLANSMGLKLKGMGPTTHVARGLENLALWETECGCGCAVAVDVAAATALAMTIVLGVVWSN